MEVAGIEPDMLPVLTLLEISNDGSHGFQGAKKYRLDTRKGAVKSDDVLHFLDDYEQKKLKPYLRSEPEPVVGDETGPVHVIVGSTFSGIVHDETVDVLVDFYAPWCGHCRKLEPTYKELAKRLRHVRTLKIAKLDATRNEVEGMMIQSYPSIFLFPAKGNRKVEYEGRRGLEDFVAFLHRHATIPFDDKPPKEEVKTHSAESVLLDENEEDL